MISNVLRNWLEDAKVLSDNRAKWDWLKFKIKTSLIEFSKKLLKDRKKENKNLIQSIKIL